MAVAVRLKVTSRSRIRGQARAIERTAEQIAEDTANDARDKARASMLEPKSGRTYIAPHKAGMHVASAPGQAPAVRPFPAYPTGGELFASIHVIKRTDRLYYVNTGIGYAKYLEFGTRHMRPRPFMRPAARKAAAETRLTSKVKVLTAVERVPW